MCIRVRVKILCDTHHSSNAPSYEHCPIVHTILQTNKLQRGGRKKKKEKREGKKRRDKKKKLIKKEGQFFLCCIQTTYAVERDLSVHMPGPANSRIVHLRYHKQQMQERYHYYEIK